MIPGVPLVLSAGRDTFVCQVDPPLGPDEVEVDIDGVRPTRPMTAVEVFDAADAAERA